jgi:hypothetical protein
MTAKSTVIPQNFLFAPFSCAKENLCGIRFVFFISKKLNRIPDKIAFLQKQKSDFSGMTMLRKDSSGECAS